MLYCTEYHRWNNDIMCPMYTSVYTKEMTLEDHYNRMVRIADSRKAEIEGNLKKNIDTAYYQLSQLLMYKKARRIVEKDKVKGDRKK